MTKSQLPKYLILGLYSIILSLFYLFVFQLTVPMFDQPSYMNTGLYALLMPFTIGFLAICIAIPIVGTYFLILLLKKWQFAMPWAQIVLSQVIFWSTTECTAYLITHIFTQLQGAENLLWFLPLCFLTITLSWPVSNKIINKLKS